MGAVDLVVKEIPPPPDCLGKQNRRNAGVDRETQIHVFPLFRDIEHSDDDSGDGPAHDCEATIPKLENRHPISIGDLFGEVHAPGVIACEIANDIPNAGSENASEQRDNKQAVYDAVFAIFFVELAVSKFIGQECATKDYDRISGKMEARIAGSRGHPFEAAIPDAKAGNQRISQMISDSFAKHKEARQSKKRKDV